jgi:hypothetical protein
MNAQRLESSQSVLMENTQLDSKVPVLTAQLDTNASLSLLNPLSVLTDSTLPQEHLSV